MIDMARASALQRRLEEVGDAAGRTAARFKRELEDAFTELRALRGEIDAPQTFDLLATADEAVPPAPVELGQCRASLAGAVVRVDGRRSDDAVFLFGIVGPPLRDPPVFSETVVAKDYPLVLAGKVAAALTVPKPTGVP
jgi:hypothetical protein